MKASLKRRDFGISRVSRRGALALEERCQESVRFRAAAVAQLLLDRKTAGSPQQESGPTWKMVRDACGQTQGFRLSDSAAKNMIRTIRRTALVARTKPASELRRDEALSLALFPHQDSRVYKQRADEWDVALFRLIFPLRHVLFPSSRRSSLAVRRGWCEVVQAFKAAFGAPPVPDPTAFKVARKYRELALHVYMPRIIRKDIVSEGLTEAETLVINIEAYRKAPEPDST